MKNFIQRCDKSEGDALGMDYLYIWTGEPHCSPSWSTRDRALMVENAEEVADEITRRYGYKLIVGSNVDEERQRILADMKSGKLQKAQAIEMLKACSADRSRKTTDREGVPSVTPSSQSVRRKAPGQQNMRVVSCGDSIGNWMDMF